MTTLNYDPTEGQPFVGVHVDAHQFVGAMPTGMLFNYTVDPRKTDQPEKVADDPNLSRVAHARVDVQRLFEGAKKRNVTPYSRYIIGLAIGELALGVTPPVVLWTEHQLKPVELGPGVHGLLLPYGLKFVAIDGETQLAARYDASTKLEKLLGLPVPVVIHHGRDIEWARQAFHDLNALAIKPNTAIAISMDMRDPLTQIARNVEDQVPFFKGRVNHRRRQLGKRDKDVVTISALRLGCVTVAKGINGIQFGARPVPIEDLGHDEDHIEEVCITWWEAVTSAIGEDFEPEQRGTSIAPAPTALAVIGAFGHSLLEAGLRGGELEEAAADRAEELLTINWERGQHWAGIAGKMTPSGRLSIAGAKEAAYVMYRALTEVGSEEFRVIRKKQPVLAASR